MIVQFKKVRSMQTKRRAKKRFLTPKKKVQKVDLINFQICTEEINLWKNKWIPS